MNKRILLPVLASLIVLPACRAPHEASEAAPVGAVSPAALPTAPPAVSSGQPLAGGKMMPIADVLSKYQSDLEGVSFYFDDQPHPKVQKTYGEYVSNRKTNAFNKTDAEACEWVAFDALKVFKKRALDEGGNAVINIHSFYKKNDVSDPTRYECHAGFAAAGVAFKGTVVKLAK